jgi:hypothetical protein
MMLSTTPDENGTTTTTTRRRGGLQHHSSSSSKEEEDLLHNAFFPEEEEDEKKRDDDKQKNAAAADYRIRWGTLATFCSNKVSDGVQWISDSPGTFLKHSFLRGAERVSKLQIFKSANIRGLANVDIEDGRGIPYLLSRSKRFATKQNCKRLAFVSMCTIAVLWVIIHIWYNYVAPFSAHGSDAGHLIKDNFGRPVVNSFSPWPQNIQVEDQWFFDPWLRREDVVGIRSVSPKDVEMGFFESKVHDGILEQLRSGHRYRYHDPSLDTKTKNVSIAHLRFLMNDICRSLECTCISAINLGIAADVVLLHLGGDDGDTDKTTTAVAGEKDVDDATSTIFAINPRIYQHGTKKINVRYKRPTPGERNSNGDTDTTTTASSSIQKDHIHTGDGRWDWIDDQQWLWRWTEGLLTEAAPKHTAEEDEMAAAAASSSDGTIKRSRSTWVAFQFRKDSNFMDKRGLGGMPALCLQEHLEFYERHRIDFESAI